MPRVQRHETPPPDTLGGRIGRQRKAAGLTVTRLARLLGVNRNTLANYESGRTEPTANDLLKLANALGCDIMDLLSETPRPRASRFAFRAHSVLLKDPQITMMARQYLRAYLEIEEITGIRLTPRLPQFPIDPEAPPFVQWIEMAADRVRESCGLRDCGPERLATALESLGVRCLFFRYEGKGLDGLSALQDEMILMMLRDRDKAIERTLFSGAHELGHLVLHPYLFISNPDEGDNGRDPEREADQFAGYFLVPSDKLICVWKEEGLHRLSLVHALLLLKKVFRVSFWRLAQRIQQAGLAQVDHRRLIADAKHLLGIQGKARMEDLEPDPLPPEALQRSTRFERLVYSAFVQDQIGVAKVAEMFQVTVDEAKEITAGWMAPDHVLVE